MKKRPSKRKLALCFLILFASLFCILSMSQWPSPTLEIAIRRQEKQQLIGPADIIGVMDFEFSPWDHLVVGQTEHGCITYEYRDDLGWDNGNLRYFEKTEQATLFCSDYWYRTDDEEWLPIFLFPEKQNSVQANMDLTITIDGETKTYQLDGTRKDSSFYLFSLPVEGMGGNHYWLLQQALTGSYSEYVLTGTVDISIEFYDISGNLTDTYNRTVTK